MPSTVLEVVTLMAWLRWAGGGWGVRGRTGGERGRGRGPEVTADTDLNGAVVVTTSSCLPNRWRGDTRGGCVAADCRLPYAVGTRPAARTVTGHGLRDARLPGPSPGP